VTTNQTQRPQYFEDQYLGAADLTAAVEYARLQQARHALGAHTWGIAAGLQLTEKASFAGGGQVDVYIQPGFAWDGFGRPVIVLAPYKLTGEKFKSFVYDDATDGGNPEGRLVEVWLRYVETATRAPASGFEDCSPSGNFSRVDELFRVEVGERKFPGEQRAPVSVGGRTLDAADVPHNFDAAVGTLYDASVPYQSFPAEGVRANWLIPLGLVRWKPEQGGQPGKFVARNSDDLKASRSKRHYIGVVAESVSAPDGHVRLRDRAKDYSALHSEDLVWVEGSLRVEGDANLFGGALKLLDGTGKDQGKPLAVSRLDKDKDSSTLRVQIGAADKGNNHFEVGPVIGSDFKPRLTVLDNGQVGIGTTTPNRLLTLQGAGGAYLNLKTNVSGQDYEVLLGADGNGGIVSTMTNHDLQLRAGGNATKVTIKADGSVGVGTTTPNRQLTLFGQAGTYLNVQSDSGAHEVLLGADGSGGIVSTMTNHDLQLRAGGNATKVIIKANGNVGIGTPDPLTQLHVGATAVGKLGPVLSVINGGGFAGAAAAIDLSGYRPDPNAAPASRIQCTDDGNFSAHIAFSTKRPGGMNNPLEERMKISASGNVGIGTFPTRAKLEVVGSLNDNVGLYGYLNAAGTGTTGVPQLNIPYSIWADLRVAAAEFNAMSDARIKEVAGRSDGAVDLRTLLTLEVTDYRYRDVFGKGGGSHKKLVAQQVERVFPQAVSKTKDVVPDIFQAAAQACGWVSLATDLKAGERVRLISERAEGVYEVLEVAQEGFRTAFAPEGETVFVYGREVDDFRVIDYDAVSMLNVSATQQLKREKDEEVRSLRAEVAGLRAANDALAQRVRSLEGSLDRAPGAAVGGASNGNYRH